LREQRKKKEISLQEMEEVDKVVHNQLKEKRKRGGGEVKQTNEREKRLKKKRQIN
jgi:hypothetical protein